MADPKIIWVGQDVNLRIEQIQTATTANNHISKYVFYSAYDGLTGVGELTASSTRVHAQSSVSSEKNYTITSYLLYSHKFAGGTAYATSNKVDNVLTVRQPLNETSLTAISPSGSNEVWSNKPAETFHITPTFSDQYLPYSKVCILKSDSTDTSAKWGSIQDYRTEQLNDGVELGWSKTTAASTDLGEESHNITISAQSVGGTSAATTGTIEGKHTTFVVKNAVTSLSGLSNKVLYAGSRAVTQDVIIKPDKPYSKKLVLVKGSQDAGNSIAGTGGAKVTLDGQTITFDASAVKAGTATQTIKFKVRSYQTNGSIDTNEITFTINDVTNITGVSIVEGETQSVSPNIGTIKTVTITSGREAISASAFGASLSITGLAVDADTNWSIDVTNNDGAKITISGKTTYLTDVSTSINTGDFIIIGTDFIAGLGETISAIVEQPSKGTASLTSDGKLKYEAFTANAAIAAGQYKIKVKGANGATRTVNINVSNITATLY